jgi:hypothetical protein
MESAFPDVSNRQLPIAPFLAPVCLVVKSALSLRPGPKLGLPAVEGRLLAVVGLRLADLPALYSARFHRFLARLTAPGAIALKNENRGVAAPAQPDGLTAWKWGTAGAAGGNPLAYWLVRGHAYQHCPNSLYCYEQLNTPKGWQNFTELFEACQAHICAVFIFLHKFLVLQGRSPNRAGRAGLTLPRRGDKFRAVR